MKASANSKFRGKAMISIVFFSVMAIFSIAMAIYDISTGRTLFGILFAAASFMFIILTLLKVNSAFSTYIKIEDDVLLMKSWVNDFLPYSLTDGLIGELKPSKTKLTEIPIDEISAIYVGTKDFIKRNSSEAGKRFIRAVFPYERSKKSKNALLKTLDIFYVETTDNDCCFMCIYGYSPADVVAVIGEAYKQNRNIYVKVNSREYRKHILKLQEEMSE